jgi:protein-S-isoprenylcysteine O-methyltransferase Ste14
MSHRTEELKKLSGLSHLIRELRYHEFSRQGIGILLVSVFGYFAHKPSFPFQFEFAEIIIILGLIIRMYASGFVLKNKELSTTGPYAYVRHPLYTGNILVLTGMAIINGQLWASLIALSFFWFYYPAAIEYEDRKLKELFPGSWEKWANKTPALTITFQKMHPLELINWSWRKSLINNYEPVIVVYVLIWLSIL